MGTVSLHALGIDEFRDVFAGSEAVAARLRALAAATWPPSPEPRTLLGKLGPFSRRGVGAPVMRPGVPTGHDLDDVVHGRDVSPARLSAAWALVDLWLTNAAWSAVTLTATEADFDALDFALAKVGVPARLGLRNLFNDAVGVPLKRQPGQATGYVRGTHATAMASAWAQALPDLEDGPRAHAERLASWLSGFPEWARKAEEAGRTAPDLLADYRP
ncbi:MAG: hypothetical protein QM708_10775 [Propioniciclava sp.]|uniref:DUF7691 family protein n=1 Tax=Propioniciclava sp. TaxID=2038686 RepID=UPI0039E5343C